MGARSVFVFTGVRGVILRSLCPGAARRWRRGSVTSRSRGVTVFPEYCSESQPDAVVQHGVHRDRRFSRRITTGPWSPCALMNSNDVVLLKLQCVAADARTGH
jgi:hypothetical protein